MIGKLTLAINTLLLAQSAVAQTCLPCDDVHFFLARGNNEPYPGRQGDLVAATCDGVASCGYENLIYSALYTDLSCQTTYDGCIAGITQLTAYAERCPNSKLILAGYSQGAQIVTDILGGGGGVSFNGCVQPSTPALDRSTSPGSRLSAVIAFGDTRHTANQPYNYGDGSSLNGLFPRPESQTSGIAAYSNIMRDWCEATDPICAGNHTDSSVATHLGYYNRDSQAAAAWIRSVANIQQNDPSFQTAIPTSVSGTAQNYATIPLSFVPSGTVTLAAVTTSPVSCSATTSMTGGLSLSSSTITSVLTSGSTSMTITTSVLASSTATQTASPGETSAVSKAVTLASVASSSAIANTQASSPTASSNMSMTSGSTAPTTVTATGAASQSAPQVMVAIVLGLAAAVALL